MTAGAGDAALGLARWAADLDRDLQRGARVAGGPVALWQAPRGRLAALLRIEDVRAARLVERRAGFEPRREARSLRDAGIGFVERSLPGYPRRLREIPDPPFGLFLRGAADVVAPPGEAPVVAIVGCRTATAQGLAFARDLARDLAHRGAIVVSGLARGIDAAAHAGSVDADAGGVAVLGTGVDVPYPRRNAGLLQRMLAAGGAVVSEHWPGTPPAPWRFPARNRIVAGMADAVVVVEAGARSGALITADFALEAGRPVLAVPGPPGAPCSVGCNALIRAGAALCEGADDVVAEVPAASWSASAEGVGGGGVPPGSLAAEVYERLRREPLRLDEIAGAMHAPAAEVAGALAWLEVEGLVLRGEGQRFWAAAQRGAA